MNLRPYQQQAVDKILDGDRRGLRRMMIVAPTGTGKTITLAHLAKHYRPAGRILLLAHREELLTQAKEKFEAVSPGWKVGVEQATNRAQHDCDVVVASVATVGRQNTKRLGWLRPSLLIVDESHHSIATSYRIALKRFGAFDEGGPTLVGVTATPTRLDGYDLGSIYQEQVHTYTLRDALQDRWLCPVRGYRVRTEVELDSVHDRGGDFVVGELQKAVNVEARTKAAIRHWQEVASDRRTVVFCAGVEHAEAVASAYRATGTTAEAIYGSLGVAERNARMKRFLGHETQVAVNVMVLTEGFDDPSVACIVMLRPTQSWSLYTQSVGRALRLAPGKRDAIVIDVVDNTKRHDLATLPSTLGLPVSFDLEGHDLLTAAKLVEERQEKHQPVEAASWTELNTVLEPVDLIGNFVAEARRLSKLSWVRCGDAEWLLDAGTAPGRPAADRRIARLNLQGDRFMLVLSVGGRKYNHWWLTDRIEKRVIEQAEAVILETWPDCAGVATTKQPWRQAGATQAQKKLLRRIGHSTQQIERMSRGAASALISATYARRESVSQSS